MQTINNFPRYVAARVLTLLDERKARLYADRKAFYVWQREGRLMVIFDPSVVDGGKVNEEFAHRLSTRMQGRLVVRTNSRGLFLQVGHDIPPAPVELSAKPLNLSEQPSPYHIPVGSSANGDIWISLLEGDSFFVNGLRGMGKSAEVHGFIQALLHGGQTLIHAWDGKNNAEYLRYFGRENFTLIPMNGLQAGLQAIKDECKMRFYKLSKSEHSNIISFNKQAREESREDEIMTPIALVIDEVAEVGVQSLLVDLVKMYRAAGVYPIFATNDPTKSAVIAKSNLSTRISFHVPSTSDSITGFGRPGANNLPNVQGRGLILLKGRVTEFQSFIVQYDEPSQAGLDWQAKQFETMIDAPLIVPTDDAVDADRVRDLQKAGKSMTAIVNEITGVKGGRVWTRVKEQVESIITTTTATTASKSPDLTDFAPEMA